MGKKSSTSQVSIFEGKITKYSDLEDNFDHTHIRGADNAFNEAVLLRGKDFIRTFHLKQFLEFITRNIDLGV